MKKTLVIATAILGPTLLLSACKDSTLNKAQVAVQGELNDPDSAQFRRMTKFEGGSEGWMVCGEVNAKNAMGGYVGYRAFVVINGEFFSMADRSMSFSEVESALKTKPLSGNPSDPVFLWSFCLDAPGAEAAGKQKG